jgi:hypothetical protein
LVGARGAFATALDAFEFADNILNTLTTDQSCNTLEIAVATTDKLHIFNNAVFDVKFD